MINYIRDTIMAPSTRSCSNSVKTNNSSSKQRATKEDGSSSSKEIPPAPMRGYKITDNERSRKYGIGANSLEVLLTKANNKFPRQDLHIYLASDGFEVSDDEYLNSLPAQTLFIVAGPDAVITTDADFEFEKMRQQSPLLKVADIFYDFIEQHPEKFRRMISDYEHQKQRLVLDNSKAHLSLKDEHVEWFEGGEERFHSKEEAMAVRAQTRVRGYYYKAKEELTRNPLYRQNPKARQVINSVLEQFRYLLIGCDYFSMMFNRKCEQKHDFLQQHRQQTGDEEPDAGSLPSKRLRQLIKEYTKQHSILDDWSVSLCTDLGDFYCQGAYSDNGNCCSLQHTINPYASRENLILFQVWNLDHQIELSRTILPAMVANVEELVTKPQLKCSFHNKRVVDISVLEYFLEIFSLKNLKLVHVVCHEKVQRSNRSNGRLLCPDCHEYRIVQELMDLQGANKTTS
ncbi:DNA fragmentation factor subunit beta isoform X2 [Drosophila pseudoobscura]|uniref:DNAation factor subunit beta isoform X2 n=1 Tax=Drosophila pseudoobscura pseudoobscura TaxID=46245 RepID=A0A6I8UIP2_DROPS|nr:DNA fragmentation factor subunit beta isoform X2 [Drosophila pseudoobscura]